jgi:hypothetical protein
MGLEIRSAERLQRLRGRIEHWRRARQKLSPMPADLWEEAAAVAETLGVSPVARALGLGYEPLQQRTRTRGDGNSGFVEMSGAQLVAAAPAVEVVCGPVVEVAAGDGARLTIRLPAGSALDVSRLVEVFRSGRG